MIDPNNFVNGMIGYVFIEIILTLSCIIADTYLLKVERRRIKILSYAIIFKVFIFNAIETYLKNTGFDSSDGSYVLMIANIVTVIIMVSGIKLASGAGYAEIVVSTFLNDVVGVILFVAPYYLFKTYITKGEPDFVGENASLPDVLSFSALILLYIGFLFLINFIYKKTQWHLSINNKIIKNIICITGLIVLLGESWGYSYDVLSHKKMLLYYSFTVVFSILLPYETSLYVRRRNAKRIQQENYALNIENTVMREYYETLSNQLEQNRKFRHDIDKHMVVIKEMLDKKENGLEIEDYAKAVQEDYKKLGIIEYCKNPVVNAIIQNKVKFCEKEGIKFEPAIQPFELGTIKETDFIACIANLMDNAIEECERIELDDKRIVLQIGTRAENIWIRIENSTDKPDGVIEKLHTSKDNPEEHGVGMLIIKDIVEKYNGVMSMEVKNGMFIIVSGLDNGM